MKLIIMVALALVGCGGPSGHDDGGTTPVCSQSSDCATGDVCRINQCIVDPCNGLSCGSATVCDDGQCVPLAGTVCDGATCLVGACEILTGAQACSRGP
jgi:hypothetical protein